MFPVFALRSRRCFFTLVTLLFAFVEGTGQQLEPDNTHLFSYYLKGENTGLKYKILPQQNPDDYQSNLDQRIFRLAYITGFIFFIDKPRQNKDVPAFNKLLAAVKKAHYYVYAVNNKPYLCYAIPSYFVENRTDIMYYFDGDYTDKYLQYLMDWWDIKHDIESRAGTNNRLLDSLNRQGNLNAALELSIDSLTRSIDSLNREIAAINHQITLAEADLHPGTSNLSLAPGDPPTKYKLPSLFKVFAEKKIEYRPQDDFFRAALDRLVRDGRLVDVGGRSWVHPGSTSTPYVHPALAEAIENINANEKDELAKMGFPNGLQITSAARTPYNQAVQIATQPVAAGLFSSGHLCGASVDFNNEAAIKAHYPAFAKMMAKYGLFADPKLAPGTRSADPKHVYLGSFKGPNANARFINDLMTACLSAYQDAMVRERDAQNATGAELSKENKVLNDLISNMDTHLATVGKKLEDLKAQKDKLDKTKDAKKADLANKTRERTMREIERARSNGGHQGDREMRDRLGREGSERDGYWERSREYSARGEGWECHGGSYENSRGDRASWGECHTTPREGGGIQRERLP